MWPSSGRRLGATIALVVLCAPLASVAQSTLAIGAFSKLNPGDSPPDWRPLTFKKIERHTSYSVVKDAGVSVIKAQAEASASGLVRNQLVDLKHYPILQWRWKVTNLLQKADPTRKSGDDYPARIYITFAVDRATLSAGERFKYAMAKLLYGEYPPLAAINYIWESKTPIGTVLPNAYTERVKMVVVDSGEAHLNQWISVRRNVYEDYKKLFGVEPPLVSGVAIMTDTDNTGENATAYYGDLTFRAQ